jgi:hypothetical protein
MSAARQLSDETLSQDLYRFAIELRQLAYTMPGRPGSSQRGDSEEAVDV